MTQPFNPDHPLTGGVEEDYSAAMNDIVAEKLAILETIHIAEPRQAEFHSRCDFLIKLGRATTGKPQKGLRVLAPSGSGKTTAAQEVVQMFADPMIGGTGHTVPVVYIALDKESTTKRLIASLLDRFGDEYADRGTEASLKKRLYACFSRFQTRLLIIDEVQHLNFRSGPKTDVTDALKRLLDDGVVPIVFLGTDAAEVMFTRNRQLSGRLLPPCDLKPLARDNDDDRRLLQQFVIELDEQIVEKAIFPSPGGLGDPRIRGCLAEVSSGVIGRVCRLVFAATEIAIRRGAERLEVYDLAEATDRWAVPQDFCTTNPFRRREVTQ